jgi:hypothetical protein
MALLSLHGKFLEQDVDLGRKNNFPNRNDFRLSRAKYQVFALDVFRKHVDQAKRRKKQHQGKQFEENPAYEGTRQLPTIWVLIVKNL